MDQFQCKILTTRHAPSLIRYQLANSFLLQRDIMLPARRFPSASPAAFLSSGRLLVPALNVFRLEVMARPLAQTRRVTAMVYAWIVMMGRCFRSELRERPAVSFRQFVIALLLPWSPNRVSFAAMRLLLLVERVALSMYMVLVGGMM